MIENIFQQYNPNYKKIKGLIHNEIIQNGSSTHRITFRR